MLIGLLGTAESVIFSGAARRSMVTRQAALYGAGMGASILYLPSTGGRGAWYLREGVSFRSSAGRPEVTTRLHPFAPGVSSASWHLAQLRGCLPLTLPGFPPVRFSPQVSVQVTSHNWSDITVYLMAGGLPQRLGMVTALGAASFDFPSQRLNNSAGVRLRALPVAGQPFTSENILVVPGQVITWTLENNLDRSSFSVY